LKVIYAYNKMALEANLYRINVVNFYAFKDMFCTFVKHGFITSQEKDSFYRSFMRCLKDVLAPTEEVYKQIDEEVDDKRRAAVQLKSIKAQDSFDLAWSVLVTENP